MVASLVTAPRANEDTKNGRINQSHHGYSGTLPRMAQAMISLRRLARCQLRYRMLGRSSHSRSELKTTKNVNPPPSGGRIRPKRVCGTDSAEAYCIIWNSAPPNRVVAT